MYVIIWSSVLIFFQMVVVCFFIRSVSLREVFYFFCVGVFLFGGNVMGREIVQMVLMNLLFVYRVIVGWDSFSVRMVIVLVFIFCVMFTKIVLMGLMKIIFFVVC